jgi:carboxypeptidase C (cathepsin A)
MLHVVAAVVLLFGAKPGLAQSPTPVDSVVTTHHRVVVAGTPLQYTARAGLLPIRESTSGEVRGNVFFMSYTLDQPSRTPPRPLTFVWNGGPGSSVSQPHLLGFGPRIAKMGDDYGTAGPISESEMEDNQETWLTATDLVFVDPVGTGYSRPTKPEYASEFYQTRGDAESIAEFIRVYRIRFDAERAPLFIAGESYGTTRAANVADVLARWRIPLRGAVLAALALPLGERSPSLRAALAVPTYTSAAFYWKKLAADLQANRAQALADAETWASGDYAPALARRDSLSDAERRVVLQQLARFTGLDVKSIDSRTLTINNQRFSRELLANEKKVLGLYDSRRVGPAPRDSEPGPYDPTTDPSLVPQILHMNGTSALLTRYIRDDLQFRSDLLYQGPFGGGYPPPATFRGDWMSTRWERGAVVAGTASVSTPPAGQTPPLRRAMDANPDLRVLSMCGSYDTVCNYYENVWTVANLDPELARRITVRTYEGGHESYLGKAPRREMQRDLTAFIKQVLLGIPGNAAR